MMFTLPKKVVTLPKGTQCTSGAGGLFSPIAGAEENLKSAVFN